MKYLSEVPPSLLGCSVDPITLTGLALAGLAGGTATALATSGGSTPPPAAAAPAPTASAPPAQNPMSSAKPQAQQQSFIGAAATPSQNSGQKTLLGQ